MRYAAYWAESLMVSYGYWRPDTSQGNSCYFISEMWLVVLFAGKGNALKSL